MAFSISRDSDIAFVTTAFSLAAETLAKTIDNSNAIIAIIAITTSNSISVNLFSFLNYITINIIPLSTSPQSNH